jgi:cellobiose epimerase
MKKYFPILLFSLLFLVSQGQTTFLGVPTAEIEKATNDHLDRWFPAVIDNENGGYYTNFEYTWKRSPDQTKMLVIEARDLWTSAKAAQLFPKNPVFKEAADHGYRFLTQKMWNKEKGGFNLYVEEENPKYQLIYGNTFALFALAEYAKINTSKEVLGWVEKTFDWIDSVAHDDELLGYHNLILSDELKEDTPENKEFILSQGWGEPDWKDQNTSIHLLEAFTTTFQVLPLPKVKTRLKEMLDIVSKTMTQPNGCLKLYFTNNWQPIDNSGKTRNEILEQQNNDHISFGHNIETAYLIIDASKTLFGAVDKESLAIAKKLTDHTLKYGFAPDYYGLYDRGYQFTKEDKIEIIKRSKEWWAQYEAWHTLALMSSYFPTEEKYSLAFRQMWKYIQNELIDPRYGGCYSHGIDESPNNSKVRKAYEWKCPYHDGRALMMVMSYSKLIRDDK